MDYRKCVAKYSEPKKSELIVENEHMRVIIAIMFNCIIGGYDNTFLFKRYHVVHDVKSKIYNIFVVGESCITHQEKQIKVTIGEDLYAKFSRKVHAWQNN